MNTLTERATSSPNALEPLMTAKDVANLLSVHENYVYDLANRGELPSYRIGGMRRFRPCEI